MNTSPFLFQTYHSNPPYLLHVEIAFQEPRTSRLPKECWTYLIDVTGSKPNHFGAARPLFSPSPSIIYLSQLTLEKQKVAITMITLTHRIRPRLPPSLSPLSPRSHTPIPKPHPRLLSSSPLHPSKPKHDTEVPVSSYTSPNLSSANVAERTTLHISNSDSQAASISTPVSNGDVARKAVPFERSVVSKMTPTMKRFTLVGKVAVVTG